MTAKTKTLQDRYAAALEAEGEHRVESRVMRFLVYTRSRGAAASTSSVVLGPCASGRLSRAVSQSGRSARTSC